MCTGGGDAVMVAVDLMLMGCHQGSVLTCVGGVGGVGGVGPGLACGIFLGLWGRFVGRSCRFSVVVILGSWMHDWGFAGLPR